MASIDYDFDAARKAGVPDEQIVEYLKSKDVGYDFDAARKAGVPDEQIVDYLWKQTGGVSADEDRDASRPARMTAKPTGQVQKADTIDDLSREQIAGLAGEAETSVKAAPEPGLLGRIKEFGTDSEARRARMSPETSPATIMRSF
jgi:hypothetical protein